MIYALNDQNERINASKAVKEKIYLCPNLECNNRELILKKGHIRIPHFAHKSKNDCSSEPESEAHISCKLFFQSLLGLDKRFVEYYGIEGVRPDVLYNQFALEIQCSPIAVKEVKRRNKIYEKNGYTAIWIFLEDVFTSLKKNKIPRVKSEREKKLERHGITWKEVPIESESVYRINYRVKKPVLQGSFQDIGRNNFRLFSFKLENEDIEVKLNSYSGFAYFNEFTKENDFSINIKQDFDNILEEILTLNKDKENFNDLKKKLNSLPKQVQGQIYEGSNLGIPHTSAYNFYDGINNFGIGMFLDQIYSRQNSSMEQFKNYIEELTIKAYNTIEKLKEWKDCKSFEKFGKKYIPVCGLNKIYHETPKAYLVWSNQWVPRSCTYKDEKYLYCEEWMYKKIEKQLKDRKSDWY